MTSHCLPKSSPEDLAPVETDWLVTPVPRKAGVFRGEHPDEVVVTNGLIRRTWRLKPNAACVAFDNLMTGESILRSVRPEAVVELDGETCEVGGLLGQEEHAYLLPEWLDSMTANPDAFQFAGLEVGKTAERFAWERVRYSSELTWPPPGVSLRLDFVPPAGKCEDLMLSAHYEMYDGIPLISKWLTLRNGGAAPVRLNRFTSEILANIELESVREGNTWRRPSLHVEVDYSFCLANGNPANSVIQWAADPLYTSQVSYGAENPCLLQCRSPIGPDADIAPGETFESFRTFELIYDSTERERNSLALRRMYRTIAPWAMENPVMMHVRHADRDSVRLAIDQCAEVGFEMVILSFGSGFDMENDAPDYVAQMKELADYAHSKGVEIGGYSLLASRRISDEDDVIDPETHEPNKHAVFGNSPCLGSRWGREYFRKLRAFIEQTGLDLLEHDGSYPGDPCASTDHPGHRGLDDSQWTQWKTITDFYKWCRARGTYLNVPDWYFLSGANKCAMGYRETNWSLPRERQILLGRQNVHDGTWAMTPSMGWMFVPLTEYHGGGAAATIEPLREHLDAYEGHLAYNFGSGVQACYRGPRLFDCDETKSLVKKWVDFYKKYRDILDSDVIHVRRADGRDIDCILHVNPSLDRKGLAMVFNPLGRPVAKTLRLPLYYTGLTDVARIREQEGPAKEYKLDRRYNVELPVEVAARSQTWFVIE